MRKIIVILTLSCVVLLTLATDANAQVRKRIAFKKNYAEVTGTIRGAETLEYVFRARRNADIEIWIDHTDTPSAAYPKFVLYKPNGALFYDENSVNYGAITDLMDVLPSAGDYVLKLRLPEELRRENNSVKWTLRLLLK
jgi:hypothetical protein